MHVHRRGVAIERAAVDRHLNAAIGGRRGGERAAVDHLVERGLIVGERRRAAQREDAGARIVARCRDATRQRAGDGEQVARVQGPSEYRDRRRLHRRGVGIGDQNIDVGDWYPRSARRVCRRGVRPAGGGVVGVEVEFRKSGDQVPLNVDERCPVLAPSVAVEDRDQNTLQIARRIGGAELHLADRRLVVRMRGLPLQPEDAGCRKVCRRHDASRQRAVDCENILGVVTPDPDLGGKDIGSVVITDCDVAVGNRHRRPP